MRLGLFVMLLENKEEDKEKEEVYNGPIYVHTSTVTADTGRWELLR